MEYYCEGKYYCEGIRYLDSFLSSIKLDEKRLGNKEY